ncbi:hypothetical protein [Alcanivorax sp.]|uniref:hypothetical protein n=1 Tax=Alcanivorax sp. TaxID=1872427 RepID=UPI0025BEBC18|nr:hypothetical protein [Alcanivorax sp.]
MGLQIYVSHLLQIRLKRTHHSPDPALTAADVSSGWLSCTLASKNKDASEFRETDSTGKGFDTRYYSAAIHKGALVMPPFMDKAINSHDIRAN